MWLENIKHLLTGVASILERHHWSIVEAHPSAEWITTDHPVVKLNFFDERNYDLKGGWGSVGTDILMPLSPRFLLHTQVGHHKQPRRYQLSQRQTKIIQGVLAQRAFRLIFARRPMKYVEEVRSRRVDAAQFKSEQQQWKQWNEEQGVHEE